MLEQRLSGVEKGPLFLLEKGVVMTSAHIGHYLLTRRTRLPIATFTSHDLRRTFATMLAEMGIALDLVAAIVGHESGGKDTRTLVRHYVHTDMLERKAHGLSAWDERLKAIVPARKPRRWFGYPGAGDIRLPTVPDRHALTLLDDTMIAGGAVGPKTRSSHSNMNICASP